MTDEEIQEVILKVKWFCNSWVCDGRPTRAKLLSREQDGPWLVICSMCKSALCQGLK